MRHRGSGRFGRLIAPARRGEVVAPVDLRYLQKGVPKRGSSGADETRGRVVTFLRGIYESVAETLPDVRDEGFDDVDAATDKVLQLPQADLDPYAQAIADPQIRLRLKPKSKGVRAQRLGLQVNVHRHPENGYEKRWLPPGTSESTMNNSLQPKLEVMVDRPSRSPSVRSGASGTKNLDRSYSFVRFRTMRCVQPA